MVYASEIGVTGTITEIAYDIATGGNEGIFSDFRLLLCYTSKTKLVPKFDDNYTGNTPATVKTASSLSVPDQTGWFTLPLETQFEYNGTDNLIVEVLWDGSNGTSFECWDNDVEVPRNNFSGYIYSPLGSTSSVFLRLKFTFESVGIETASLGEIKAAFK